MPSSHARSAAISISIPLIVQLIFYFNPPQPLDLKSTPQKELLPSITVIQADHPSYTVLSNGSPIQIQSKVKLAADFTYFNVSIDDSVISSFTGFQRY